MGTSPQTVHYVQKNIAQPTVIQQPQSIQYQIIQTEDGVQMVQEIQTVQAVEAVEMPKVMLCGYCNAPFTKKHYLTEHMAQHHLDTKRLKKIVNQLTYMLNSRKKKI